MSLNIDEIKHVAGLARVGLNEGEIEKYQNELSQVLDYFKKLEDISTEKVEPIGHITGMDSVLREDKSEDCDEDVQSGIMKNAPDNKDNYFKVKSVF